MKPSTFLFAPAVLLAITACSTMRPPAELPDALATKANEHWVGTLSARGAQVYECRAVDGRRSWAFVEPDATLFDRDGRAAGHHGAGPFWQAVDGSRLEGRVIARADAPAAGAIPWLLLEVRSTGRPGRLDGVSRIRRVNTGGGLAPQAGCDAGADGARVRVAYTADYLLYEER
jgi:hypothetical protein